MRSIIIDYGYYGDFNNIIQLTVYNNYSNQLIIGF